MEESNNENLSPASSDFSVEDGRYRQLASQLFGDPVVSVVDVQRLVNYQYKGPCVKLGKDEGAPRKCGDNLFSFASEWERCLICYSRVSKSEQGQGNDQTNDFVEFLGILTLSLDNFNGDSNRSGEFGNSVGQSSKQLGIGAFCPVCRSVYQQVLWKRRAILKLQQQVADLKQKIFAAIQLSTGFIKRKSHSKSQKCCLMDHDDSSKRLKLKCVNAVRSHLLLRMQSRNSEKQHESFDDEAMIGNVASPTRSSSRSISMTDIINVTVELSRDSSNEENAQQNQDLPTSSYPLSYSPLSTHDDESQEESNEPSFNNLCEQRETAITATSPGRREKGAIAEACGGNKRNGWKEREGKLYFRNMEIKRNGETNFLCPFGCQNFSYAKKDNLVRHINKCHVGSRYAYSCDQCDKKFYYISELDRHKGRHERRHQCELCGFKLSTRQSLNLHKKLKHLGTKTYSFTCQYCSKMFRTKQEMDVHVKRHTGERSFVCDICGKSFILKGNLASHMVTKHPDGGTDKVSSETESRVAKYKCDICNIQLYSRVGLYLHKRVKHQGIKPHVCEHCGKGFGRRGDMLQHVRQHTGERPFACPHCSERFALKSTCKNHLRRKHPQVVQEQKQQQQTLTEAIQ